jgi:hypothetical protein
VKSGLVSLLLSIFLASAAQSQSHKKLVFSNIDDNNTGWGSCTSCAGGANDADVYWMAQFQTAPSRDGNSAQFYISASQPYSNVLFWEKVGVQDWATQFTWDFWVYLDNASLGAQALEYDVFQFVGGIEYMFGTECTYATGLWNVWNQGGGTWVPTQLACQAFTPNVWHHIVWQVHRTPDTQMHYDSLTLDGIQYSLNLTEPSGPLPSGWTDNLGVQWQLDTASSPLAFNEWIDNVKLTIR